MENIKYEHNITMHRKLDEDTVMVILAAVSTMNIEPNKSHTFSIHRRRPESLEVLTTAACCGHSDTVLGLLPTWEFLVL